jgi:hypothetical protein
VLKALGDMDRWAPNMLILDRLESSPGLGAGSSVFECPMAADPVLNGVWRRTDEAFPAPVRGGKPAENKDKPNFVKLDLSQFDDKFEPAVKKLRRYYARLGFRRSRHGVHGRRPDDSSSQLENHGASMRKTLSRYDSVIPTG